MKTLATFVIVLAMLCSYASAEFVFDLVQDDESVLATLTLADLSSDPADIVRLEFSETGQELFGFGPIYGGTFDQLSGADDHTRFALEFDGIGLTGRADNLTFVVSASDSDPPPTSLDISPAIVTIIATDVIGSPDAIRLGYRDPGLASIQYVDGFGNWRLVPEPSTMPGTLICLGLLPVCRKRTRTH